MGDTGDEGVLWTAVDAYLADHLIAKDDVLEAALRDSEAAELPPIQVTALQGKMLQMFARMVAARRILEVGTLGGYSTIWLARALPPDGRLVTLELDPGYAAVAERNVAAAGLGGLVEIRVGPAIESLAAIAAERPEPFDLAFIDADKASTPEYFEAALELCRPGGVIVADNVVRGGTLADPDTHDPGAIGNRRFHELLAAEPRVEATTIQTVGAKGYDGFTLALIRADI
jgi:predicted O-methyltransferase YrrM